ncbi:AAA family ATPase [Vulcanococcus sp.]|jgi:DNA repair exonuclease SbcCD ATPase subunit|uniref:AAA family ATPase n=1 Tax=Vulcanococcus sp. TaxID=2856995 RepID=UPI0037D9C7CC
MRLRSCRLRQVRQHGDLEIGFGRQLTLVGGANEAGKSTLVEALHKGLFLRATATGRGVEELRSRIHAGLPEIEIRFEAAGELWHLRKRFSGASGTCQLSGSASPSLSGPAAEERLAQLLGYDAPVEGRRIAQLPERWAHLWVRQGSAGDNPIEGNQERYDYNRLVDQLQGRGQADAVASPLDQQVLAQLEQRLGTSYTATGRVKAGSPLAQAQQRDAEASAQLQEARQRVLDLEAAMEQWRSIGERLETIDQQQRPALQRHLQLLQRRRLLSAELQPLVQQRQQRLQLLEQQRQQQQEQGSLQQQLEQQLEQQRQLQGQVELQRQQQQQASAECQRQQQLQGALQQLLDLRQLEAEQQTLQEHRRQLQRLQAEADQLKTQLAALPELNAEQVRQLRQAEQALLQLDTRCQAMATTLEVIASDQPIRLEGDTLRTGDQRQLSQPVQLQVGAGVVLRLSPGGGEALPALLEQRQQAEQHLLLLREQLGVANSDAGEQLERQRRSLEAELTNLRQAARAIPWAGLEERLGQLQPRRQRLEAAVESTAPQLAALAELPDAPGDPRRLERHQLEGWLEQIKARATALGRQLEQAAQADQQRQGREQQLQRQLDNQRSRLAQLEGSLRVIDERLQAVADTPSSKLQEGEAQLQEIDAELAALQHGSPTGAEALEATLQALEEEKNQLLSQRGQAEQRCQSLGAVNPQAELEQRQAVWEEAQAERQRLERQGQALQLLQERFHRAQAELANRYSEPLREAIRPYLAELADDPGVPLLSFDPQQGFQDLQLRQRGEAYGFAQLSGGMREQLAAALRLAMAEVLLPAYDGGLPLVFDDAFSQSDAQRQLGLQRMLRRAMDQGIQLVVLSCQPESFEGQLIATATPTSNNPGGDVVCVSLG